MSIAEHSLISTNILSLPAPGGLRIQLFSPSGRFSPFISVRIRSWIYTVEMSPHNLGPLQCQRASRDTMICWRRLSLHCYEQSRDRQLPDAFRRLREITRRTDISLSDRRERAENNATANGRLPTE